MTDVERKPAPKPVPVPDRADRREASLLRWIRLQTVLTGVIVLLLAAAVL